MAITATYTVTLSASDKDHARGEYVYASIVRTSPATLVPEGLYVQSATINMAGTTFWSGSGYNPYLDFGDIGRVFVSTSVTDKTAIPITTPTDFNLDELLSVGTVLNNFYIYGYKSSNGNVCTYPSNNAQFTITATVVQQYAKSSARVTSSVEAGSASTVTFINPYLSNVADCYTQRDVRHGNRIGYDLCVRRLGAGNRHVQFHHYSAIVSCANALTGSRPDQQLGSFLVGDIRSGAKRSDNNRDGCGVPGQHDLQLYDLRRGHRDTVIQRFHDLHDLLKRNHHVHREGH